MSTNIPGIKKITINGQDRYTVRTTLNNKKHSLGTFLTLDAAAAALFSFRMRMALPKYSIDQMMSPQEDALAQSMVNKQERQASLPADTKQTMKDNNLSVSDMMDLLNYEPPHLLSGDKSHTVILDNGEPLVIPAGVVALYISNMYGTDDSV